MEWWKEKARGKRKLCALWDVETIFLLSLHNSWHRTDISSKSRTSRCCYSICSNNYSHLYFVCPLSRESGGAESRPSVVRKENVTTLSSFPMPFTLPIFIKTGLKAIGIWTELVPWVAFVGESGKFNDAAGDSTYMCLKQCSSSALEQIPQTLHILSIFSCTELLF